MMLCNNIESTFDISDKNVAILYIDSKLLLESFMDLD